MSEADYKEPSPAKLRYIAILSSELHITEPVIHTEAEANRMLGELKKEKAHRAKVKSDVLSREIYNVLASNGMSFHYTVISSILQGERPNLGVTDAKVLATLNNRKDLFEKLDVGVYFLAGKSTGRTYDEI